MKYVVRPEVLLKGISREYMRAHDLCPLRKKRAEGVKSIIRGGARTIASLFEDMLAQFLYLNLKKKFPRIRIYVNQPISMEGYRNPRYPDLAICLVDNCGVPEIKHIVEAKMNTGWMRSKAQKFECLKENLRLVRRLMKSPALRWKMFLDKSVAHPIRCSEFLASDIVIAEGRNDDPQAVCQLVSKVNSWRKHTLGMSVLTYDELNGLYNQVNTKSPTYCNRVDFDRLLERIEKSLRR